MNIDFGLDGIGHQLQDRLLKVPLYQRSYAWRSDQVTDFRDDLLNAIESAAPDHFLGTIVLSQETADRITVIDGQQRLATTALLLAAIRDYYDSNGEIDRGNAINSTLNYFSDDLGTFEPRLTLNAEDDEFFRQFIVRGSVAVASTRESHILMAGAYSMLTTFVVDQCAAAGANWIPRLVKWRKFIEAGARVIYVSVPTDSDAFMIFETLNDRGADLTLADLLKNYLFGKASSKAGGLDQVRGRWVTALGSLDVNDDLFVTFLRHLWNSKHGATRERDLYKEIKLNVSNAQQAIAFASEIEKSANLYAAVLSSEDDYWTGWGTTTKTNVETLNRLSLEQIRPLLLAVLQHFTRAEAKKTLRLVVNWGVRGLVVGGIGGGSTEKAYCDAAVAIRSGAVKTALGLGSQLDSIIPTDPEFEAAFSILRVPKTSLSRYYLLALQAAQLKTSEPELVPNSNEEQVNLEHVLPRNAKISDWPTFPGDLHKQWVDRLGNQTLLAKGPNDKIGNKPFSVKKPILAASQLTITSAIESSSNWTPASIEARQKDLARLAVSTWKRKL